MIPILPLALIVGGAYLLYRSFNDKPESNNATQTQAQQKAPPTTGQQRKVPPDPSTAQVDPNDPALDR